MRDNCGCGERAYNFAHADAHSNFDQWSLAGQHLEDPSFLMSTPFGCISPLNQREYVATSSNTVSGWNLTLIIFRALSEFWPIHSTLLPNIVWCRNSSTMDYPSAIRYIDFLFDGVQGNLCMVWRLGLVSTNILQRWWVAESLYIL